MTLKQKIGRLHDEGLSVSMIAAVLHTHANTVRKTLINIGETPIDGERAQELWHEHFRLMWGELPKGSIKDRVRALWLRGYCNKAISRLAGVSDRAVTYNLEAMGFKMNPKKKKTDLLREVYELRSKR